MELAWGVEKVKCALMLRGVRGAVRLFRDEIGCVPNDGTQGECDKAGEETDFGGCLWCEGGGCGRRSTGGGEGDVEECGDGSVWLSGCGGEQEEYER